MASTTQDNKFKQFFKKYKKIWITLLVIAIWIIIWQVMAMIVNREILIVSPLSVVINTGRLMGTGEFYFTIWTSFYRIMLGFLLATVVAIILAFLSYKVPFIKAFLQPPMVILKAVPVVSFIIILLVALRTREFLPIIITFMMGLPIMYTNTLSGLENTSSEQLEMAQVFKLSKPKKIIYIYGLNSMPFFVSGVKIAVGLCWKSGVAAELIGLIDNTIGDELYFAKLGLEMANLFSWTLVIVALSIISEKLLVFGLKQLQKRVCLG